MTSFQPPIIPWNGLTPILILCCAILTLCLLAAWKGPKARRRSSSIVIFSLAASLAALSQWPEQDQIFWQGALIFDQYTKISAAFILVAAIVFSWTSYENSNRYLRNSPEIGAALLTTLVGMLAFIASTNAATLLIGLELSSIGLYVLVGYSHPSRIGLEGALKYFLMGSFANAFFVYGVALLYTVSGSLDLVQAFQLNSMHHSSWALIGLVFLLSTMFFKLALVPYHGWAADVDEAAPTSLTGFMAVAVKITILTFILRLSSSIISSSKLWADLFMYAGLASILVGHTLALIQTSLKRMLAYSSIAHSGYLALVIASVKSSQLVSLPSLVTFYLVSYGAAIIVIFSILLWFECKTHTNLQLSDLDGLASKHPVACFSFAIAILSLAGLPPMIGFFSKFLLLSRLLATQSLVACIIVVLASITALYYYLRILVRMYFCTRSPDALPIAPQRSLGTFIIIGICTTITIAGSTILPHYLLAVIESSSFLR